MYYTYVLQSGRSGQWYTGSTADLRKRLSQHNKKLSTWTRDGTPWKLIYYEACPNKEDSVRREQYLKTGNGKRYLKARLKHFLTYTG